MEYTEKKKEQLWELHELNDENEENIDIEKVQRFLNDSEMFCSFGENLSRIIREKMPLGAEETPAQFLLKCSKESGVILNRNTVVNWISGGLRPKKGNESRENMFKIAFALNLSVEETYRLFHCVYLDRSFNFRRANECIYYYCINTGRTYQHAQNLLEALHRENNVCFSQEDRTIGTQMIGAELKELSKDKDILQYIREHPHNFSINNRAALKKLHEYKEKAEEAVQEELGRKEDEKKRGESRKSVNFMFRIITGQSFLKEEGRLSSLTGKYQLLKEISNNFPQPQVLSRLSADAKKELTYDEIRKLIIFFYSYWYWERMEAQKSLVELDEFENSLSDLLDEINYSPLYYGNPYDWLYLYCAITDRPLDTFREILDKALPQEG